MPKYLSNDSIIWLNGLYFLSFGILSLSLECYTCKQIHFCRVCTCMFVCLSAGWVMHTQNWGGGNSLGKRKTCVWDLTRVQTRRRTNHFPLSSPSFTEIYFWKCVRSAAGWHKGLLLEPGNTHNITQHLGGHNGIKCTVYISHLWQPPAFVHI